MVKKKILIADDDSSVAFGIQFLLELEGYEITIVTQPRAVLSEIKLNDYDALLLDMNFQLDTTSGQEGLSVLGEIRELNEVLPVIMMTGWANVELAVNALKCGANDFLQKPVSNEQLSRTLSSHIKSAQRERKLQCLTEENKLLKFQSESQWQEPIARSAAMNQCLTQLSQLAKSDMNILLTGENGCGKSLLAHYIHQRSNRSHHSLITVNMGAISEHLFESEMFGHEKGAFTDAKSQRIGRFELADNGTLFLDEIANIPLSHQSKLLRVLEESQFERVGSSKTMRSTARIISATNANLTTLIEQGQFRQDLFFRLNTVEVRVPSLRDRAEDIEPLALAFLQKFSQKYKMPVPAISEQAWQELMNYRWPGNIRELSHMMEKALFTTQGNQIDTWHLGLSNVHRPKPEPNKELALILLDEIEKQALLDRLSYFNGNATKAADSLGISRSGWYRRVEKYNL